MPTDCRLAPLTIGLILSSLLIHASYGLPEIEPFQDEMLPKSQLGGDLLPGLGRIIKLKTHMNPKPVESMKTSFSIHPSNGTSRGIKYHAPNPQTDSYHYDLDKMKASSFDPNKKTVVLIPGYRCQEDVEWVKDALKGWLELYEGRVNVITVSWIDSNSGIYSQAVASTVIVARQLTIFLYYLAQVSGTSIRDERLLDSIHLIGHSLGAHIAGFVGQDLGGRVGRITGLDPAGPSFDQFSNDQRLDRTDAKLVEVLHTNSGKLKYLKALASAPYHVLSSLWSDSESNNEGGVPYSYSGIPMASTKAGDESLSWFGIDVQIGHIDYYANDGSEQPGCPNKVHVCDHRRAAEIYVDRLFYEISLRSSDGFDASRDKGRLMAFKASDYESFETGRNFAYECPDILSPYVHFNLRRKEALKAKCTIPLFDIMTPLNELIDELRHKYMVNFDSDSIVEKQPRYYFKTTAGSILDGSRQNLIGDHHLLRIYMTDVDDAKNKFKWRAPSAAAINWCSLRIQMTMADGQVTRMDLGYLRPSRVEIVPDSEVTQQTLSIPFVYPYRDANRIQFENLLGVAAEESEQQEQLMNDEESNDDELSLGGGVRLASEEFSSIFRRLLPKTITLGVAENKPGSEPEPMCQLSIKALEVHPLDERYQSIGALYGYQLALDKRIPVLTNEDLVRRLSQQSHLTVVTRLATDGGDGNQIKSFGTGLEAALVGDLDEH